MSKKYYLTLDDYEHSLLIHTLNDKRNELIQNGKYTDAVDEVLVKVIEAPKKEIQNQECRGLIIMEKSLFEQMGGTYTQVGDYLLPNLTLPEEENKPVGIWGQHHLWYIKQHKRVFYTNLLTACKLNSYLADIDEQAENLFCRLVKDLAEKENVTEKLKAENQMLWVQRMNSIRNCATEVVNADLIYA